MFNGGEFVRLKADYPNYRLQAGDCGLIWGVYIGGPVFDLPPPVYEATFHNAVNGDRDMMFNEHEVELVEDVEQTPCSDWLLETKKLLDSARI